MLLSTQIAATPDDARFPRGTPPDDGDNFLAELVPNNVVGPYRVMEAARTLGLQIHVLNAGTIREIEAAFATLSGGH